jgi:N-acetylated-alpha-linked acidic dipeptidase
MALRAADADLLPARESDFAASVSGYDEELHKLVDKTRAKTRDLDKLLSEGAYTLAQNPRLPRAPPSRLAEVPELNFAELDNAVERLKGSAKAFDAEYLRVAASEDPRDNAERVRMNAALSALEASLTDSEGLPGRPWYQHMMYAPGLNTGYGVKTLPGIREAIEERHWDQASQYMAVVAHVLNAYSHRLDLGVSRGDGRARGSGS